ncbi:MAG: sigma-70 family RNA polymerase sigma factor [Planctomycetes bacterium]|nr:sigma-70 family RNA polymerase sigma factor [Planctomycetota bacterium]
MSLLSGLSVQQPEAWQRLVQVYGPLIYTWCRQRGLQAVDAEDVVQEVFRVVLTRIAAFRKESAADTFRGWLWTITRNKLGDYWRRCTAQPQAAGGSAFREQVEQVPDTESAEPGESAAAETAGVYRRALALIQSEFEEKTWQAFWRVVCENQRPAEVAKELQLSLNAVYLAKSRVLRALRETLGDAAEE